MNKKPSENLRCATCPVHIVGRLMCDSCKQAFNDWIITIPHKRRSDGVIIRWISDRLRTNSGLPGRTCNPEIEEEREFHSNDCDCIFCQKAGKG